MADPQTHFFFFFFWSSLSVTSVYCGMAITIFESCKKRKRVPAIFNINNFATQTSSLDFRGPFRENISLFLREYADTEDYKVQNNPIWCTLLLSESNGVVFPLYTLEESIKQSSHPFCNLCRCVGEAFSSISFFTSIQQCSHRDSFFLFLSFFWSQWKLNSLNGIKVFTNWINYKFCEIFFNFTELRVTECWLNSCLM